MSYAVLGMSYKGLCQGLSSIEYGRRHNGQDIPKMAPRVVLEHLDCCQSAQVAVMSEILSVEASTRGPSIHELKYFRRCVFHWRRLIILRLGLAFRLGFVVGHDNIEDACLSLLGEIFKTRLMTGMPQILAFNRRGCRCNKARHFVPFYPSSCSPASREHDIAVPLYFLHDQLCAILNALTNGTHTFRGHRYCPSLVPRPLCFAIDGYGNSYQSEVCKCRRI